MIIHHINAPPFIVVAIGACANYTRHNQNEKPMALQTSKTGCYINSVVLPFGTCAATLGILCPTISQFHLCAS